MEAITSQFTLHNFRRRLTSVLTLDEAVFEEVEADETAFGQAMTIVVLSSLASSIGSASTKSASALAVAPVVALVGWMVWAALMFVIGTKMLPEVQTRSSLGEVLRTTGFALSPGLFGIAGIIPIPVIGNLVLIAISVWTLMAMVMAVQHALDFRTMGRAVLVVLMGWVSYMGLLALLPTGIPASTLDLGIP
jgi:Yip1 domain